MLKASQYNVFFSIGDEDYLFNTWKGNLVALDLETKHFLNKGEFDELGDKRTRLIQLGFITECENEFEEVVRENEETLAKSKGFSICVCPTFRCNAHCYYCFEAGIVHKDIDEKTLSSTIRYICEKGKDRKTHITWFGGEPLLGGKNISSICRKLHEKGIVFYSTMITNGYFLDTFIDEIKSSWNLKRIQITLDGLEENYNSIKQMGPDGFKRVISNIHLALANHIQVSIRINYDASDIRRYEEIIRFVHSEFGNDVRLYFHDIVGEEFKNPNEVAVNPLTEIFEELIDYGYVKNLHDLKISRMYKPCAVNSNDFVNVFPNGDTNKCEHFVGKTSPFDSGNINDRAFHPSRQFQLGSSDCKTCVCFPICAGGCLADHMIRPNYGCCRIKTALKDILRLYVTRLYGKNKALGDSPFQK